MGMTFNVDTFWRRKVIFLNGMMIITSVSNHRHEE